MLASPFFLLSLCLGSGFLPGARGSDRPAELANLFGVLQDDPAHWKQERDAGLGVVVLEPSWNRYEPLPDTFDTGYIDQLRLALRLGGGRYNELNYPSAQYHGHPNCYWGFDDLAQGRARGLPPGIVPCPTPGWQPGTPFHAADDASARRFINWYLDSLKNYHDWQIATARQFFADPLAMLYPSWGVRPGQLDAAIADGLSGKTGAEINGEVSRGFDFARFIHGISDPGVIVYCTWVDAHVGNDLDPNPAHWSPVHYLSSLAQDGPLHLRMWGENTGRNSGDAMTFAFEQMRRYHLLGLV